GALGGVGERLHRSIDALVEVAPQELVRGTGRERYQLVPERLVDGLGLAEGLGRFGAPPVEVLTACSPMGAFPLPDGRGDVAAAVVLLVAAKGELPAHVGLEGQMGNAAVHGCHMERATGAGGEAGTVEEDARAVHQAG